MSQSDCTCSEAFQSWETAKTELLKVYISELEACPVHGKGDVVE